MTWLATGRLEAQWAQTSSLMAVLINGNPHRKNPRAVSPRQLNPMVPKDATSKASPDAQVVDLARFKALFNG